MGEASVDEAVSRFLAGVRVGDLRHGTIAAVARSEVSVTLDGFAERPLGVVGPLDVSWCRRRDEAAVVGRRVAAEVIAVEPEKGRVRMSMAAAENPELWAFLKGLRLAEVLAGTVASIESFGVFVALDDGPGHPVFPGVGFITCPELSWRHFDAASEVVEVGQRVACEFLQFDTSNGEARLSLRAMEPDPLALFVDGIAVGERLRGRVTKVVPFGFFVRVADGVEGLVPLLEPGTAPEDDVHVGAEVSVLVADFDRERRRLTLAL
ncbi:S1 RNA-binding domain-containing protein [Streptomyces sp. NPDC001002]